MLLEVLIAGFAGIIIGTITGLTPGIHNNTINSIILSLLPVIALKDLPLTVLIVTLAISHTIIDFIPSIFTGATDGDSFLATLPGHEMLKEGRGIEAVYLSVIGACAGIPVILIVTPLFIWLLPSIIETIQIAIPFLLIFVSIYSILREQKILLGLSIWFLSGFLGYSAFNLPVKDPLLPLLSGLFGGSGLIISILEKTKIPKQNKLRKTIFEKKEISNAIIGATISAPLCSFLPTIGSGHAATIGSELLTQSRRGFMIMIGAINTIVMTLSFVTLYSINKGRTGASAAIKELLNTINPRYLIIIVVTAIITIIISSIIATKTASIFAKFLNRTNYRLLSILMLVLLGIMILIFSNYLGLWIFITGSALGIFTVKSGVKRINLMGCLMIPTILYYLFL